MLSYLYRWFTFNNKISRLLRFHEVAKIYVFIKPIAYSQHGGGPSSRWGSMSYLHNKRFLWQYICRQKLINKFYDISNASWAKKSAIISRAKRENRKIFSRSARKFFFIGLNYGGGGSPPWWETLHLYHVLVWNAFNVIESHSSNNEAISKTSKKNHKFHPGIKVSPL